MSHEGGDIHRLSSCYSTKPVDQENQTAFKDLVIFSMVIVYFYVCERMEMNFNAYQALRLSYMKPDLATPPAAAANKSSQSSVLV